MSRHTHTAELNCPIPPGQPGSWCVYGQEQLLVGGHSRWDCPFLHWDAPNLFTADMGGETFIKSVIQGGNKIRLKHAWTDTLKEKLGQ